MSFINIDTAAFRHVEASLALVLLHSGCRLDGPRIECALAKRFVIIHFFIEPSIYVYVRPGQSVREFMLENRERFNCDPLATTFPWIFIGLGKTINTRADNDKPMCTGGLFARPIQGSFQRKECMDNLLE